MLVQDLKKIEVELTTRCNARCPGCARTLKGETNPNVELADITLENYKKILHSREYIEDKEIFYCGVLGDPIVNKDFKEICEYTLSMDPKVLIISTNGGLRSKEYWSQLGTISKNNPKLDMRFCVDGYKDTNHLYRVGVNWDRLVENMTAYSQAGGKGQWVYNPFDHNIDDIEKSKQLSTKLGFKFTLRYSMKQEDTHKVVNKKTKKIENKISLTNTKYQHPELKKKTTTKQETKNLIIKEETKNLNIKCKLIHEGEIYLGANHQIWPCCYLYDNNWYKRDDMVEKFSKYDPNWNDSLKHDIQDILDHEWFSQILKDSWDENHSMFLSRCQKSCSHFGKKQHTFAEI